MITLSYNLPRFLYAHKIIDFNKLSLKNLKRLYAIITFLATGMILISILFPILRADDYTDGLANDFTDTTVEGTAGQAQNITFNGVQAFGDAVSSDFAPGLESFFSMFGVNYSDNVLIKNFALEAFETGTDNIILDTVMIFGVISYVVATTLFIIGLIRAAIVAPFEKTDSPGVVLFRYIKALILITISQQLLAPVMVIARNIFNLMESAGDVGMGTALISFINGAGGALNLIPVVGVLIKLVFLYIVLKEFVKLNVEVIERYMMSCFLHMFSCIGFSFTASNLTEKITTNFLVMYVTELFLLILNQFFVKTTMILMTTSWSIDDVIGVTHPLTTIFVMLAWMRLGQHIDENLKGMGLSVARTGGNLFDSALGAGMAIAHTMGSLGKSAASGAGSLVGAQGMAMSDPNKVQVGSLLKGKPMTTEQAESKILDSGFEAASKMPVREAQVSNVFDGVSNNAADKQFSLKSNEYMTGAFGSDWQTMIAGVQGHVNPGSLQKGSNGIITGTGIDKDGNEFDFSLSKNGQGLKYSQSFAETVTKGTPWNIQYGQKGGFSSMPEKSSFTGQEGVQNFLNRAGMSKEQFTKLTGEGLSDITSISMVNGSARLNTANGTIGAIHEIGGAYRYSNTSSAPAFGTKGIDRSNEIIAGASAMQRNDVIDSLSSKGIEKPSMPAGTNWKHASDFTNPNTGITDDNYVKIDSENAYFDKSTGTMYTQSVDSSDYPGLVDDPIYTEATADEAQGIANAYNMNLEEGDDREVIVPTNSSNDIEFDDAALNEYSSKYKEYMDNYSQTESDIIKDENEYISSELMSQENLSSVDEIDANEKIIHATSKEHGPVTYSYRVIYDQGPDKSERVIGGNQAGHNMLAYKKMSNRRVK